MLNIVLVEPEIPQNTGNIARTCAATGARLHLIGPMGFAVDSAKVKRAGLDYWWLVDITYYDCWAEFADAHKDDALFFLSTKARTDYSEARYPAGDTYLVFGKETKGLPEQLLRENYDRCFRLPMVEDARSLNLSNAAAVAAYDYFRRMGFPGLKRGGTL
ncbi:MAG: tRNA (cytidine(34)-2'-O)-methyltransferase [Clostridiales bacterium]|jgi:tRNA (cytidine/uridine-2'-O-)-methyltransferase|nr:tRNA (cytidine(34)-2'-O)-methyltransferase [Clostridiales bacterium]